MRKSFTKTGYNPREEDGYAGASLIAGFVEVGETIGEAQRRLIHTEDRIDDIAVTCGYMNLSYFYASFKKNVGCTPMEFRNAYKNEAEDQMNGFRASAL